MESHLGIGHPGVLRVGGLELQRAHVRARVEKYVRHQQCLPRRQSTPTVQRWARVGQSAESRNLIEGERKLEKRGE